MQKNRFEGSTPTVIRNSQSASSRERHLRGRYCRKELPGVTLLLRCYSIQSKVMDLGQSGGRMECPELGLWTGHHPGDIDRLSTDQKVAGSIPAERTR